MQIRHYLLGFSITSLLLLGCSSRNAQAEPTTSQCQRFEAVLTHYNDRISDTSNDPPDRQGIATNLLSDLKIVIEDLESQTFDDETLRSLHQQMLEHIMSGRDNVATYLSLSATEQGEQTEAETAFNKLQLLPYQMSEVVQQFEQYCGASNLKE
jgi:VanZ family protein